MDKASWDALIASEIEAGRPVLYSGQDVSVGHAFVCDGYETRGSETYFHINWGWGGTANAYFASDALNPSVSRDYHFNDQTTIVYNIKPAAMAGAWSHTPHKRRQPDRYDIRHYRHVGRNILHGSRRSIEKYLQR